MAERLFPAADGPRVFGLPPGVDFGAELLAGLDARIADWSPEAVARIEVVVNTARARRRLLALAEDRGVWFPPRIRVLSDMVRDDPALPPLLPPIRRRLELARLVRALLAEVPEAGARASAYAMADGLATILAEMQIEGVSFQRLATLDAPEDAGHWQRSLRFLTLIRPVLEAPEGDAADPDRRLALAMARRAAAWIDAPPVHPVIVAGSTGSRGATARFMAAVAALPQGAVVLPGLDAELPAEVWAELAEGDAAADHPQAGLARFSAGLGIAPGAVENWSGGAPPSTARNALVSLAMRPAPVTDQWLRDGPALVPSLDAATEGLTLMEARDPREEAGAIALALRRVLAQGQRAALVTPDRTLARQVRAMLDRWGIEPDDSAGRPLDLTPPGGFLRLSAALLSGPVDPVTLIALLKHPLTASTEGARGRHMHCTGFLERRFRSDGGPVAHPGRIAEWAGHAGAPPGFADWAAWLAACHPAPLKGAQPLGAFLTAHLALAEKLAAGPGQMGSGTLWEERPGQAARLLADQLTAHAEAAGEMPVAEYRALLRSAMAGVDVPEPAYLPDPRVAIWGTLEARTQSADLIILGGLNEGTWPRLPRPDPWLSRTMRAAAGMPQPERQIGLSAHDFQQAIGGPQVILSRAIRDGEAPTVPARWLLRLTNLMTGLGPEGAAALQAMRRRGDDLLAVARRLDDGDPSIRARRPAPVVPASMFPAQLPVTTIERLVRDPYAVYARHILRLRKLDPLARVPDHMERGIRIHAVLEKFVTRTAQGLPADAEALFRQTVEEVLEATVPWPAARRIWIARLQALAAWFVQTEADRRRIALPHSMEAQGSLTLDGVPCDFTLTARADRIDTDGAGAVAIYDYKGGLPGKEEARLFHKQLPLEGWMALNGGFPDVQASHVAALTLIGTSSGGKLLELDCDADSLAQTWDGLRRLIAAYQAGGQPFRARARIRKRTDAGDYDQLARLGEWQDGDPVEPEVLE
ncbi:double-strand break repair protein AddB [Halovulum dunhuangense]|uniref:Double-strand break repair protein AddB n=1 Tax=Halovulum dunhuangense TaxID=1505036 RepID=A0A849KZK3_9RHOB|nr:double-strand break repair protein AddB [Halovulum dunhuangense]NNU79214.1 double-strand break repair protein AddB [Halovulum dunhuangense]